MEKKRVDQLETMWVKNVMKIYNIPEPQAVGLLFHINPYKSEKSQGSLQQGN